MLNEFLCNYVKIEEMSPIQTFIAHISSSDQIQNLVKRKHSTILKYQNDSKNELSQTKTNTIM